MAYKWRNNSMLTKATRDLKELVDKFKILKRTGDLGTGTNYVLIGSIRS